MTTIRTKHDARNKYTLLNNKSLWDSKLSLAAAGLWARLLSRPDDWEISTLELQRVCNCGKHTIYKLIDELISHGYIIRSQTRTLENKKNQFGKYEYLIFESSSDREEYQKSLTLSEIREAAPDLEEEKRKCPHIECEQFPDFQEAENRHVTNTKAKLSTNTHTHNACAREEPIKFGTYVSLTKTEYEQLVKEFGKGLVDHKIIRMEAHCSEDKPVKGYKNYYKQLRGWCSEPQKADKVTRNVPPTKTATTTPEIGSVAKEKNLTFIKTFKQNNSEIEKLLLIENNEVIMKTAKGERKMNIEDPFFISYLKSNACQWFGKETKI